jgi:hypothetical protein
LREEDPEYEAGGGGEYEDEYEVEEDDGGGDGTEHLEHSQLRTPL